jgi:hypothetical protein
MAENIRMNIRKNYLTSLSKTSYGSLQITEDVFKKIFGKFWEPSVTLSRAADRIRSSSLDLSDSSEKEESEIISLEKETGINLQEIVRSISLLSETLEDKVTELNVIEDELQESEVMIKEYDTRMGRFSEDIEILNSYVDNKLKDPTSFVTNMREIYIDELLKKGLSEKLEKHRNLIKQIRQMRSILKTTVVKHEGDSEGVPICKICLTEIVRYAVIVIVKIVFHDCQMREDVINVGEM